MGDRGRRLRRPILTDRGARVVDSRDADVDRGSGGKHAPGGARPDGCWQRGSGLLYWALRLPATSGKEARGADGTCVVRPTAATQQWLRWRRVDVSYPAPRWRRDQARLGLPARALLEVVRRDWLVCFTASELDDARQAAGHCPRAEGPQCGRAKDFSPATRARRGRPADRVQMHGLRQTPERLVAPTATGSDMPPREAVALLDAQRWSWDETARSEAREEGRFAPSTARQTVCQDDEARKATGRTSRVPTGPEPTGKW